MDFVVNKQRLHETSTVSSPPLVLREGDVLIRIEKFAFTSNNVSYAATGEALGYWKFFPVSSDPHSSEGRIPVWGVGVVVASRCHDSYPGINRRIYGYFPMSHYVVMRPVQRTLADFIDGMPHRRTLPAVYNQYLICDEDPFYTPRTEEAMIVWRPLFFTSWLLLDFFQQQSLPFFGATNCIISSASSKTSLGLAFLLFQYNQQQQKKENQFQIIGLTSAPHKAFVESLSIYSQVILYDNLETELDATAPSCFVDMAGNTKLTTRLHHHLRDHMKYTCLVGAAHVGQGGKPSGSMPGAKPKFFFAPSWTARRIQELGGGKKEGAKRRGLKILLHKVLLDYQLFINWSLGSTNHNLQEGKGRQWLHMKHFYGPTEVSKGYSACLQGQVEPDTAVIMSLWEEPTLACAATSRL